MVRDAYLAMDWIGWFVLVPLSLPSLLTGLVMSLGTQWGLFRHYWVLAKLLINLLANIVLLLFMQRLRARQETSIAVMVSWLHGEEAQLGGGGRGAALCTAGLEPG